LMTACLAKIKWLAGRFCASSMLKNGFWENLLFRTKII
jgi:hypothetical protein